MCPNFSKRRTFETFGRAATVCIADMPAHSVKHTPSVTPAKAGVHLPKFRVMDPRFRGGDELTIVTPA